MTQNNLTIALVSAFPPGTGTLNEYGLHLATNFAANENVGRVIVLAEMRDTPDPELDLGPKIEVQRIWDFNKITTARTIARALKKIKPDLALYNLQVASFGDKEIPAALGLFAPLLSRNSGVFSGVIAHNMVSSVDLQETVLKGQKLRQLIVKSGAAVIDRVLLRANYITFTLPSYVERYQEKFPKASIHHVPHGTFDTGPADLIPYEKRPLRLVTMGKFGTYKRLENLIKAVDKLVTSGQYPGLELVIGGTDHNNAIGYMASVEDANQGKDYIKFHGYVAEDDIPEFFGNARISVFDYSSTTGSSGVLHQTASYGTVPVFPAIGDFIDITADEGLRGENYKPNDADDMAAAIARVLDDAETAAELGESNRLAAMDMPFSEVIDFHLAQIPKP